MEMNVAAQSCKTFIYQLEEMLSSFVSESKKNFTDALADLDLKTTWHYLKSHESFLFSLRWQDIGFLTNFVYPNEENEKIEEKQPLVALSIFHVF